MEKGKENSLEQELISSNLYLELYEGVQQIKQGKVVDWDDVYKEAKAIEKCMQSKRHKNLGYGI